MHVSVCTCVCACGVCVCVCTHCMLGSKCRKSRLKQFKRQCISFLFNYTKPAVTPFASVSNCQTTTSLQTHMHTTRPDLCPEADQSIWSKRRQGFQPCCEAGIREPTLSDAHNPITPCTPMDITSPIRTEHAVVRINGGSLRGTC